MNLNISILLFLILTGISCNTKKTDIDKSDISCRPIEGLNPFLRPGQIILIGEIHGTKEGPGYAGQFLCNGASAGLKVALGLELPIADEETLRSLLRDRNNSMDPILNLHFWSRNYQDGRASIAMYQLLLWLKEMRKNYEDVELFLIDQPEVEDRDNAMARAVIQAGTKWPEHLIVVLTGNMHNTIYEDAPQMGSLVFKEFGPERVFSVAMNFRAGTAWADISGNGAEAVEFQGEGRKQKGLFPDPRRHDYHGTLEVDSIHFSPPAKTLRQR